MIFLGVKGGQNPDGSQKDGFLKYEKNRPSGVYDINSKAYVPISDIQDSCDKKLGELPQSHMPWKTIIGNSNRSKLLDKYFSEINSMTTLGAELARKYSLRSKEIGLKLVSDKIANSNDDVNTVLLTGFYHAYGPINNYVTGEVSK